MADLGSTTPLIALDAIVLDTETTGLDPRQAWVVEIAAVRITRGKLQTQGSFRRLVSPGVPIPASTTRIHGIDDAEVAEAQRFADVWRELKPFLQMPVAIGHAVAFDLSILQRECARAGLPWSPPRSLDTRLLAQIAEPKLSDYSLENLAAWLGVEVVGRHSALGDATTAARIFLALVPKLRERNIRTLAEAERACLTVASALDRQVSAEAGTDGPASAIDTFPYRYRVGDIMTTPAKFVSPDTPLRVALDQMARESVSSLFVQSANRNPDPAETSGIVTERDVLRVLARDGGEALHMSVGQVASRPLFTVPRDAFAYRAMARMNRLKIRHLAVTGDGGAVIGAISARDLLRLRFEEAIEFGDQIEEAADVPELAHAWAKLPQIAAGLLSERLPALQIADVISRRLRALSERAALLAEQRMRQSGQGAPPCAYAVAVLGSAGRGESLLAMDQDNALVFAQGEPDGAEDRWFGIFGGHVAEILHEAGVPYCKGGVMAKNAAWRGSVATWHERVRHWVSRSSPGDLLSVDIFFDLRGVHGDLALANALREDAFDVAKGQAAFAKLLAEAAGRSEPGLTWFGGFKTDRGRINLKKAGLFGIVSAARALAICHHVRKRSTPARLAGLKAMNIGAGADLDALADAQEVFLDLILAQQIVDIAEGRPASNTVVVKSLAARDRERLKTALHVVSSLEEMTRELLF